MKRRHRTILFYGFLALFLLISPGVILFAKGYRFDIEKKTITKTGGIFLKASQANVQVLLDEKFKKRTDLLLKQAFITNLVPKNYLVTLKKREYYPWQKKLAVEAEKVTEARNILLIKEQPLKEEVVRGHVKDPQFSKDGSRIAYLTPENELVVMELNTKNWFIAETLTGFHTYTLLGWSHNNRTLFIKGDATNERRAIIAVDLEGKKSYRNFIPEEIIDSTLHPSIPDTLLILLKHPKTGAMRLVAYTGKTGAIRTVLNGIAAFTLRGEEIIAIERPSGLLVKSDLAGSKRDQLSSTPFEKAGETEAAYTIAVSGNSIAVKENDVLWLNNKEGGLFTKVGEGIMGVAFSSLEKTLLWWTPHEIWILVLEEIHIQPFREKGDALLITRLAEKISDVHWYSDTFEHIIFLTGSTLKITEVDGRDKRNTYDIATLSLGGGMRPLIRYDKDGIIYISDENGISRLKIN